MAKVTGIGGIFFLSNHDHKALSAWYQRHLGIPLENRHRARDDAYATARVLIELLRLMAERGIRTVGEIKLFESGLAGLGTPAR